MGDFQKLGIDFSIWAAKTKVANDAKIQLLYKTPELGCLKPSPDEKSSSTPKPCLCLYTLRIQVCPKKGINPTILLWGWDWDHQTYSREGYASLGIYRGNFTTHPKYPDPSKHSYFQNQQTPPLKPSNSPVFIGSGDL